MKWEAKDIRKIVWESSKVLDLCECDVMEKLDKELAGDVGLVTGESFNCNKDGGSGNDERIEGENLRC